jgi:hypothetical protein
MADLDPKATPSLMPSTDVDVITGAGGGAAPTIPGMTLNLKIDLGVAVGKGQAAVSPMTVVYAPDPKQLDAQVDILLWFHGHKGQLNKAVNLRGFSAGDYLLVPEFKFREFILKTSKRKFLLVFPTLGDKSGAGLLNQQGQAEAFLQQVLNGVRAKMNPKVTGIGKIVLAAHSGGGAIMGRVAGYGGTFDKVREIWCVDCTYGSAGAFVSWAKKPGHAHDRLWAFSTGSWWVPKLKDPSKPQGPDNPVVNPHDHRTGTGDDAQQILALGKASKSSSVEALIKPVPPDSNKTANFTYGVASGHNESVGFYFPQLVNTSRTLS